MNLKKENKLSKRKSHLLVFGSFLFVLGVVLIGIKVCNRVSFEVEEKKEIQSFYEIQKDIVNETQQKEEPQTENETIEEPIAELVSTKVSYVAVLKIPALGLEKGLCSIGSYCNNVNRNIEILKESTFPDKEKSNLILVSHSGTSSISYFKHLDKLAINDTLSLIYKGKEYVYKIVNIYDIPKNGTANIVRNLEKRTLTLITCRKNTDKQMIIISELMEEKEYEK